MTRLILVGGFLGAGKTTLLYEAARKLERRKQRVGLITNDQAPELVDTIFLSRDKLKVAEVSGSCFCCNFQGLLDAISKLRDEADADVIIAEPVGSCTDLSATIIQPLKKLMGQELVLAPLSVTTDPVRLMDILDGGTAGLHPSAAYIFRKQLEEADMIVVGKADQLMPSDLAALKTRVARAYPKADVIALSAKTGKGLDTWMHAVMTRSDAGQGLAKVDYDIYAEGEAVLGWLNASFTLNSERAEWNVFAEELLNKLSQRFDDIGASAGHIKLILEADGRFLAGNLTDKINTLNIRGSLEDTPEARLTINARVEMLPEALGELVSDTLDSISNHVIITPQAWCCLSPGRPNPTHRYKRVVNN